MAGETSVMGNIRQESMKALSRDHKKLAISFESTLYQTMIAPAKLLVRNTPNLQVTLSKVKTQHSRGAVSGLMVLLRSRMMSPRKRMTTTPVKPVKSSQMS